ncbi:hypothetical protein [Kurthia sibirica]|uniref:Uncharacterized protein n=1 Tax=Kurthia sibirica TaxID=202750 RepID=A0A2U3APM7_9BACL|nr:hypothetical protein [Kurthia sibirica]PWI26493.1 hypothetical protein DEX24_03950 [Kurthia sibirica]GEK33063.1 hypothetical protein KSI01_05960 [Kurthia sibirica]
MITISNEYKESNKSILDVPKHYFEYFHVNLVEIPLLEQLLSERKETTSYYPSLYRDLWFMLDQSFNTIEFSEEIDFSNEVLAVVLKKLHDHPTFHIIHDLSHDVHGNPFISAFFLSEMVSLMIDAEIKQSIDGPFTDEKISLRHFVQQQLDVSNCLEGAAQAILHTNRELPLFVDIIQHNLLPLPEKTTLSLNILNETFIKDDIKPFISI